MFGERRVKGVEPPKDDARAEGEAKLEAYKLEAQKLVDSYRGLFASFAKDVSLTFKMGDAFFINLEKGEVSLDTKWFVEKGFSRDQIIWAVMHELSHFRDLAEDPKRMMAIFEYQKTRAKESSDIMAKKFTDVGREVPKGIETHAQKFHHTFFNVFDDIHVNAQVESRAPAYERGTKGGNEVTRLYREKLFKETDYTKLPRHLQFLYSLLREEMVEDEPVAVTDEVQAVLNEPIALLGKSYTPQEFVAQFIRPKKRRDTRAGERYTVLKRAIEPVYLALLKKDLEEWELPPEQGSPQPMPFEGEYDEFADKSPDQIPEEQVKDWMDKQHKESEQKKVTEEKKKTEENKTSEQKAADAQAGRDKDWCEKNKVSSSELKNFRDVEARVAPYLEELSELWDRIIYGEREEADRELEGHFKTGSNLDIQEVVGQWPKIQQGQFESVRVMQRMVEKDKEVKKPERINVRLLCDMSGSMSGEKHRVLQECMVLLASSIEEFNNKLLLSHTAVKHKISADTEIWGFGDSAEKLKSFREDSSEDSRAAVVKTHAKLRADGGSTHDNDALLRVNTELDENTRDRIASGKVMEIILEITDGGSSDPGAARHEVDRLLETGAIVRALQIGETDPEEARLFRSVWNDGRAEPLGQAVGKDIGNLLPVVTDLLKKYLASVRV